MEPVNILQEAFENILNSPEKCIFDFKTEEGDYVKVVGSLDHTGGLEGYYCDVFDGTLYINNKAYYFEVLDRFCTETDYTLERDVVADLQEGDKHYTKLD